MRAPFSKGFFVGGAIASAMTITKGLFPGGKWDTSPTPRSRWPTAAPPRATRSRTTSSPSTSSTRSSSRATRPATTRPTTSAIQSHVPRELAQDLGHPVPGAGLRDPRGPARERRRRGRRQRDRLELRPVRRDQRQGRAADDARGRRRAAVPGDLSDDAIRLSAPRRPRGRRARRSRRARRQGRAGRRVRAAQRAVALPALHDRGRRSSRASQLSYLTEVDHHDHEALIAFDSGAGEAPSPSPASFASTTRPRAEAAVTVDRRVAGQGPRHALCKPARRAGPRGGRQRFTALLLADNDADAGRARLARAGEGDLTRGGHDRGRGRHPRATGSATTWPASAGRRRRHDRAGDPALGASRRRTAARGWS